MQAYTTTYSLISNPLLMENFNKSTKLVKYCINTDLESDNVLQKLNLQ